MKKGASISGLQELAEKVRRYSLQMAFKAGNTGSHIGGSLSCIEIFAALYGYAMNYDVKDPLWMGRDRFIASKAHCILSNYAVLSAVGFFDQEKLYTYLDHGGMLCGHPYKPEIGLEFCGGSLGMGISAGVGMAISAKYDGRKNKVYVLLGDGECNEGSVWEGFMASSQYHLDNLTFIIDHNNMQFDGRNDEIMSLSPLKDKLIAFGLHVEEADGHSLEELCRAFDVEDQKKPKAIIAHTIKARGIKRLENRAESHHAAITQEECKEAIGSLKGGSYDRV